MKGGLLLDVIIGERPSVLELFTSEDQPLLVWGDAFFVLDLGFDILNGVGRFNLEGDGFTSQGLHKDLHTSSQPQDKMKRGLLLDVVVGQSPSVLQLLSSEDQPLLIRWDSFFVLDLGFDVLDGVRWFDLECDRLTGQCLHKDLHTSSEPEDKVKGGLLLNVVVGERPSVFELFACEDQPLLVWRNSFLVLDLCLHVLNGVGRLNLEGDGLTGQGLHEDLHTSSQPQDKMKGGLLLDVVVRQSPSVFELFACEDQPLLVWGDSFFVLDLGFDVLDGVRRLNLEGDGLTSQCLHEDLHTSSK